MEKKENEKVIIKLNKLNTHRLKRKRRKMRQRAK